MWWAVIPARWGSRRLPGKVTAVLDGRPMLEHVWRAAAACPGFDRVVIATDSEHVCQVARGFGAEACLTGPAPSGTARASLVAPPEVAVAVVQADQPGLRPEHLGTLQRSVDDSPIGTLWTQWSGAPDDPHQVKIRTENGRALDFARAPWPGVPLQRHVGLYAFRPGWLGHCTQGGPTPRALEADLEQLSWLDRGFPIGVRQVGDVGPSVDTWPQLVRARAWMGEST